jgi:hypothetical protein
MDDARWTSDRRRTAGSSGMNAVSHGRVVRLLAFSALLALLLATSNVSDSAAPSNGSAPALADVDARPVETAAATPVATASDAALTLAWHDWDEHRSIEPTDGWIAAYIDIVGHATDAEAPSPPTPRPEAPSPPPQDDAVVFGLSGDIGGQGDHAGVVLAAASDDGAEWFGGLGDLSYSEITPESAWCDWIRSKFRRPFEIVAGNHEDDEGSDGDITKFAKCLKDRMHATPGPGGYAANYFFDDGPVRMIMLSADLSIDGTTYDFTPGSRERRWLVRAIRDAPDWVIVGTHKVCLTMGSKRCEIRDGLIDLLHSEGVDVTVHGHDHTYQRTHALTCSDPNTFRSRCIGDDGADGTYRRGVGTVHVIAGTAGRSLYECDHRDAERRYFAAHFCAEEGPHAKGFALVRATGDQLDITYRNVIGRKYKDRFVIE